MTTIKRNALVPYSAEQMYQLVDDIPHYADFLEWCDKSEEESRNEEEVVATLHLSWNGMHKSFSTRNRLHPNKMIHMRLAQGPFKHLEGYWLFEKLDDHACKIAFTLEFEFANPLLGFALSKIFEQIAGGMVDAFMKRADALYGKK